MDRSDPRINRQDNEIPVKSVKSMNCKKLHHISCTEIFVMGNQSADLDSCVSAISLSALITFIKPEISCMAMIQGNREDLRLKPEIEALFTRSGLDLNNIIFTSDPDAPGLQGKNIILVDHNHPEKENSGTLIQGIVDHHKDSGQFPSLLLRDIRLCGSCGSIISEYWKTCGTDIPYSQRLLLAGTIEVDTGGLSEEWGKATDLDRDQLHWLESGLNEDDRLFLKTLDKIKNNLDHLSMMDHLTRDYKDFPIPSLKGGISSVPLSVSEFFREGFFDQRGIESFSHERCPGFLLIMHSMGSPLRRELSLYCPEDIPLNTPAALLKKALEALDTTPLSFDHSANRSWYHYHLNDPKTARKVLVPLLMQELS